MEKSIIVFQTLSHVLMVMGLVYVFGWSLLASLNRDLKKAALQFVIMNIALVASAMTLILFGSIEDVIRSDGLRISNNTNAYFTILSDFLAVLGVTLCYYGKAVVRKDIRPVLSYVLPPVLMLITEAILVASNLASDVPYMVAFSAVFGYVLYMILHDMIPDFKKATKLGLLQSIPYVVLLCLICVRLLITVTPHDSTVEHNAAGSVGNFMMWGYLLALGVINTTLLVQVIRTQLFQIQLLSLLDHLTGIWGRKALTEKVNDEHMRVQRNEHDYSVIMFDLDDFKRINDTLGHAAGDAALQMTAKLMHSHIRRMDAIGRWGGEEFLILLPRTNSTIATALAEKLKDILLTTPLVWKGTARVLSASFGVAQTEGTTLSMDAVIERADAAMYKSKEMGKNRVSTHGIDKEQKFPLVKEKSA